MNGKGARALLVAGLLIAGCPSTPAQGGEREPCYGNGTCNAGLTCASDVCVRLAVDGGVPDDTGDAASSRDAAPDPGDANQDDAWAGCAAESLAPDCRTCVERDCCAEASVCGIGSECAAFTDCIVMCTGGHACMLDCRATYPTGSLDARLRAECVMGSCAAACPTLPGGFPICDSGFWLPLGTPDCATCNEGCCSEYRACADAAGCVTCTDGSSCRPNGAYDALEACVSGRTCGC